MSNGAGAAVAAAGHAAAIQAIKASGILVRVEPDAFLYIAGKSDRPVIVVAQEKFLKTTYKYMTSHGGLVFYAKSPAPLMLPARAEIIAARKIWMPS
jgi:hypothetical protein